MCVCVHHVHHLTEKRGHPSKLSWSLFTQTTLAYCKRRCCQREEDSRSQTLKKAVGMVTLDTESVEYGRSIRRRATYIVRGKANHRVCK